MKIIKNKKRIQTIVFAFVFWILMFFITLNNVYAEFSLGDAAIEGAWATAVIASGGVALIIFYVVKLIVIAPGMLGFLVTSATLSGFDDSLELTGLKGIIFAGSTGGSKFLDVNFFDFSSSNSSETLEMNQQIAKWYYVLRLVCVSVLLVILIYVGIRMALSTVASEQVKYKQMLTNWAMSMALLFLLHYIMILIVRINNAFVETLYNLIDNKTTEVLYDTEMVAQAFTPGINSLFPCIIFTVNGWMTFSFFYMYLKRLITVGFLVMIAPLITITYSIDKMGDGKAQALNAWLKEFSYNVLIQPFHCIIYLTFFGIIESQIAEDSWSIGPYILALVVLNFMKKAEEILRKIFHFEASSMSSISESGKNLMAATGTFAKMGTAAGVGIAKFRNSGGFAALRGADAKKAIRENKKNVKATKKLEKEYNKHHKDKYDSFKDYLDSDEGKSRLSEIKEKPISMKKLKQANDARREKKKNEKIEKSIEKDMGTEAFQKLIHDQDSSDPKVREAARKEFETRKNNKAEEFEEEKKESKEKRLHRKLENTMGTEAYNKLIENTKSEDPVVKKAAEEQLSKGLAKEKENTFSNRAITGYKNFSENVNKNFHSAQAQEALKDSVKVATAIGFGAAGFGLSGKLNDVFALGQTGYGFADGLYKNSSKTLVDDGSELAKKIMDEMEKSNEEMKNMMTDLHSKINADEIKDLPKELDKIVSKMTSITGDSSAANNIKSSINNGFRPGEELNYKEIVEEQIIEYELDDGQANELRKLSDEMCENRYMSLAAANLNSGQAVGMTYANQINRILENLTQNNNYIENVTENNYYTENVTQNNNYTRNVTQHNNFSGNANPNLDDDNDDDES